MTLTRRSFVSGLIIAIASPAIVRASSLMRVKAYPVPVESPPFVPTIAFKVRPLTPGLRVGDVVSIDQMSDQELLNIIGIPRGLLAPAIPDAATRQRFVVTSIDGNSDRGPLYVVGRRV